MGATNEFDRQRIVLEEGLAHLVHAEGLLRAAARRMVEYARTRDELEVIEMVVGAREHVEQGRGVLVGFHPQALSPHPPAPSPVPSQG